MKLNYKRCITCFIAMFFAIVGVISIPDIGLAAETKDIVVQINAKQEGEDIDIKNKTYYVALFKDAEFTDKVQGPRSIQLTNSHSGTTTFTGLSSGTYYVAQTDADGVYLEEDGVSVTCSKTDNAVTISDSDEEDSVTVIMTNDYEYDPNEVASSSSSTTTTATTQSTTKSTINTITTASTTRNTVSTTATNVVTDSAKTADDSHITFYSIIAFLCIVAAGWIVYDRKKAAK